MYPIRINYCCIIFWCLLTSAFSAFSDHTLYVRTIYVVHGLCLFLFQSYCLRACDTETVLLHPQIYRYCGIFVYALVPRSAVPIFQLSGHFICGHSCTKSFSDSVAVLAVEIPYFEYFVVVIYILSPCLSFLLLSALFVAPVLPFPHSYTVLFEYLSLSYLYPFINEHARVLRHS